MHFVLLIGYGRRLIFTLTVSPVPPHEIGRKKCFYFCLFGSQEIEVTVFRVRLIGCDQVLLCAIVSTSYVFLCLYSNPYLLVEVADQSTV